MSKIMKAIQSKNKTSLYIADYSSEGKEQYFRFVFDVDLKDNWVYEHLIESCIKRAHSEGRFTIGWLEGFFGALGFKYEFKWYQEGHDEIPEKFFEVSDDFNVELYAKISSERRVTVTKQDLNDFNEKLDNMTAMLKKIADGE